MLSDAANLLPVSVYFLLIEHILCRPLQGGGREVHKFTQLQDTRASCQASRFGRNHLPHHDPTPQRCFLHQKCQTQLFQHKLQRPLTSARSIEATLRCDTRHRKRMLH